MKNVFKTALVALVLTGLCVAQQEVNPDHFEGDTAKQPVKVKQIAKKSSKNLAATPAKHHTNKSVNKPVLSARAGGN